MSNERWVQRTADEYAQGLNNLLPTGPAWPRNADAVLQKVVRGLAEIWGDPVEQLAALLLAVESDPRSTFALLPDWERAWGLPDECLAEPLEISDRRTALIEKITLLGAQSRAFFIALALRIGYVITITEYSPFIVGIDRVGDTREYIAPDVLGDWPAEIGPPEMRFYWTVHVSAVRLTWYRSSVGQAGVDPHLRIALATDLECILRRYKPAHTEIIFDYSGVESGDPMAGTP
jgi:uncharacterized protein YmfQ (DUF2313 family)